MNGQPMSYIDNIFVGRRGHGGTRVPPKKRICMCVCVYVCMCVYKNLVIVKSV
jgi:hypothetical protein